MRLAMTTLMLLVGMMGISSAQKMARAEEPEEVGLTSVGESYFPNPGDRPFVSLPNPGFEEPIEKNAMVEWGRFEPKGQDGAVPEGEVALFQTGGATASLVLNLPAREVTPHLLTLWLKTNQPSSGSVSVTSKEIYFGKNTPLVIPNTEGEWKRVGFFFRTAPGTTAVRVLLRFPEVCRAGIDHLKFREATEAEFARAWLGWRETYPERDLAPRAGDGRNLSSFIGKLEKPLLPDEPLQVIGIGSSYTNMLGNGERLVQWVRDNYPEAPPVHYQKHVGSAVEFDYTRGWMRQHVIGKGPDLVILYSGGSAEDLEALLQDFRAHSSADVIVASLHLRERDQVISDETVNAPEWDAVRDVALKYGCEWVDNRREWAAYLETHEKPIEWLLKDAVHQSDHGALVINENLVRHLAPAAGSRDEANRSAERLLTFGAELVDGQEGIRVGAGVNFGEESPPFGVPVILGKEAGGEVSVLFQGNRIDLIGRRSEAGGILGQGKAPIRIDEIPLDELPVFVTTLIVPGAKNHRPERGLTADRAPHLVTLGEATNLLPQTWTLRMTSDTGDYELIGSITGPDGMGNNATDFTSDSGQISVPTELWRRRLEKDGSHANRKDDTFTWEVRRATVPTVDFQGEPGPPFRIVLADQLENGWHQLTLSGAGSDGIAEILGFVVHEPPLGRKP